MKIKDRLLQILERQKGRPVSGEEIARLLSVSRAAVWKAARSLREAGYDISAATNRGYVLAPDSDILSADTVCRLLERPAIRVLCHRSLDSTNSKAMRMAAEEAPEALVVLAEEQTAGRGRRGRTFFSPAQRGLYMSILLHPDDKIANALRATIAASVAVCRTIEDLTGLAPSIKWVNDILLNGKKICGILTEGVSDFETGTVKSLAIGIGINLTTRPDEFPPSLRDIATSLGDTGVSRNEMAAGIVNRLIPLLGDIANPGLIEAYRARSSVLEKKISYEENGQVRQGRAKSIDPEGALVVENEDGSCVSLRAGEISIRESA